MQLAAVTASRHDRQPRANRGGTLAANKLVASTAAIIGAKASPVHNGEND